MCQMYSGNLDHVSYVHRETLSYIKKFDNVSCVYSKIYHVLCVNSETSMCKENVLCAYRNLPCVMCILGNMTMFHVTTGKLNHVLCVYRET